MNGQVDTYVRVCHNTDTMRDSLGRRRKPSQNKGLRPLYPRLPRAFRSAVLRIAMSDRGWAALEHETQTHTQLTKPRAIGNILERALGTAPTTDWQDWQIRKEKQLLGRTA
jgi:hypothetical protein